MNKATRISETGDDATTHEDPQHGAEGAMPLRADQRAYQQTPPEADAPAADARSSPDAPPLTNTPEVKTEKTRDKRDVASKGQQQPPDNHGGNGG